MTLDRDKQPTGWRAPMSNRRFAIVVVVAGLIMVGAVVAWLFLDVGPR